MGSGYIDGFMEMTEQAKTKEDLDKILRQLCAIQIQGNLFPVPPYSMIDVAVQAVQKCAEDKATDLLPLPPGVAFRGKKDIYAGDLVYAYRLQSILFCYTLQLVSLREDGE